MNLTPAYGARTRYTWKEVCDWLQMPLRSVRTLVYSHKLPKAFNDRYPFTQKDINQFVTHWNAGRIQFGVRK